MAVPGGFDIQLCLGASAFQRVLNGFVRSGEIPASMGGYNLIEILWGRHPRNNADPVPRFLATVVLEQAGADGGSTDPNATPAPRFDLLLSFLMQLVDVPDADDPNAAASRHLRVSFEGIAGLYLGDIEYPVTADMETEIETAITSTLEGLTILDVDALLARAVPSIDPDLDPGAASVVLAAAAGATEQQQDALVVLIDLGGVRESIATLPPQLVLEGREWAVAFSRSLLNNTVFPRTVSEQFESFPSDIERDGTTVTINSLSLLSEGESLHVDTRLAILGQDIHVQGPLYLHYHQVSRSVIMSTRDITADVTTLDLLTGAVFVVSLLNFWNIFGQLGLLAVPALVGASAIADSIATTQAQQTVGDQFDAGLIGGLQGALQLDLDNAPLALVMRHLRIVDGSLILGGSLYTPFEATPVAASGGRRLNWIELRNDDVEDGDILSVADLADLMVANVATIEDTHVVSDSRRFLRRNPDNEEANNLREMPRVDLGRLPESEQTSRWFEAYYI